MKHKGSGLDCRIPRIVFASRIAEYFAVVGGSAFIDIRLDESKSLSRQVVNIREYTLLLKGGTPNALYSRDNPGRIPSILPELSC